MLLTDADQLREALVLVMRERDAAQKYAQACEWALEAEQEYTARLKADLALECREVAERQRQACAGAAFTTISLHPEPSPRSAFREAVVGAVLATLLVTEGNK